MGDPEPLSSGRAMRVADFDYPLPEARIAQHPAPERTASRLLCVDGATGELDDRRFADLEHLLRAGDLLVMNNTRVQRARLFATKPTGGRVEVLIERVLDERRALALLRASKPVRTGAPLGCDGGFTATVGERAGDLYELRFAGPGTVVDLMERHGHVPLPPYIRRDDDALDAERYQTVYASKPGAVAAPTAGLHFDVALLERLREKGVGIAEITLHVGLGTFMPVRGERVEEHRMHAERVAISPAVAEEVNRARGRGGRVVAVGTTCVRALESACGDTGMQPFAGETDLFIYPGYEFGCVDALLTNFHLPRSTLLMLVCAFGGVERILAAYRHAVDAGYRFYSYGDAMFVTRRGGSEA